MLKADRVHSTPRTVAPDFHQPMFPPAVIRPSAKRVHTPAERPLVDVDTFSNLYALTLDGDCLEPLIPDGASVIIQKSASYSVGDIVCVWWRSEFVQPGMYQGWLKRVTMAVPPWVKKFPYNDHPKSDVKAIGVFEQLNPPQTYAVPCERIHAIHKAVAYGPAATGGKVRSDRLLPIGDGIVPQLA